MDLPKPVTPCWVLSSSRKSNLTPHLSSVPAPSLLLPSAALR